MSAAEEQERRAFAFDLEVLATLELRLEDLADPDVRAVAIRAQHPEYDEALSEGAGEVGGVNPRMHLAMHEVVTNQLWEDNPPEVWETAVRLRDAGYDRHEILHMLVRPLAEALGALAEDEEYDLDRHIAGLHALPGSWERERTARRADRQHEDARKRSRRQARASRRANRRPK